MEGLWGWGGWEADPPRRPACITGRGLHHSLGQRLCYSTEGKGNSENSGIQLVMGVWDSASSPVTKLGPGAQRVAKLWVDLNLQDCSQVSRCPPPTLALQPQGNRVSQVPPRHCTLCSAGQSTQVSQLLIKLASLFGASSSPGHLGPIPASFGLCVGGPMARNAFAPLLLHRVGAGPWKWIPLCGSPGHVPEKPSSPRPCIPPTVSSLGGREANWDAASMELGLDCFVGWAGSLAGRVALGGQSAPPAAGERGGHKAGCWVGPPLAQ